MSATPRSEPDFRLVMEISRASAPDSAGDVPRPTCWSPESLYLSEEAFFLVEPWLSKNAPNYTGYAHWGVTYLASATVAAWQNHIRELQTAIAATKHLDGVSALLGGSPIIVSLNGERFPVFKKAFLQILDRVLLFINGSDKIGTSSLIDTKQCETTHEDPAHKSSEADPKGSAPALWIWGI